MLKRQTILSVAVVLFAGAPSFAQTVPPSPVAPKPAAQAAAPKSAAAPASTPESRSAAALALSHEPVFDEGSAQRIKDAALSYSDLAVRGGWPIIPSDAKFAMDVHGPNDDLLRTRLIIS